MSGQREGRDWITIVIVLFGLLLIALAFVYTLKQRSTYSFADVKLQSPLADEPIDENTEDEASFRLNMSSYVHPLLQKMVDLTGTHNDFNQGEVAPEEMSEVLSSTRAVAEKSFAAVMNSHPPVYLKEMQTLVMKDISDYNEMLKVAEQALQGNDLGNLRLSMEGLIRISDRLIGDMN